VSTCNAATFDTRLEVYDTCGTLLGCNDDGPGCSGFTSDLTVAVTAGADIRIRVTGYNGATGTGTLTVAGPVFPDDCATAQEIATDTPTPFDTTTATPSAEAWACTSNTTIQDIWFTFTATADYMASATTCGMASYDTRLEVFDGSCGALVSLDCNDDACGVQSEVNWMAVTGTQYWVRVGGFTTTSFGTGDLLVAGPPPAVPNDECVGAIALANGVAEAFDTTMATNSAGAPAPSCGGSTPPIDIWYTVTPVVDGVVDIDLCGSSFDTRVVAYDGDCGALNEVGCNDDACGLQSQLSFPGIANTTYYVRVAGFNAGTGAGMVSATFADMLPNDDCAGALSIGTGITAYNNEAAMDSGVDMPCVFNGEVSDVWFSYAAGTSGPVTVDLSGSDYDTGLSVWEGDCANLVLVDCDDDGGTGLTSLISFNAVAGTTYYLQCGGFNGARGNGLITLTEGLGMIVCLGEPNSTGAGAALRAEGSLVVTDNNLMLGVSDLPANSMGYFVHSMETIFVANPGGSQGNLCIASFDMGRFANDVLNSGSGSTVSFTPDLNALPIPSGAEPAMAGETRYFQYWYRDTSMGGATSNFSSAVCVTFE
jgi:hypothetical protein